MVKNEMPRNGRQPEAEHDRSAQPVDLQVAQALRESERRFRELSESLEQQVQARTQAIRLLHDVTMLSNQATNIEAALKGALASICRAGGWHVGHAWMVSQDGRNLVSSNVFELNGDHGSPTLKAFWHETQEATVSIDDEFIGLVARKAEPVWRESLESVADCVNGIPARHGFQSGVALPIRQQGQIIAILGFLSISPTKADPVFLDAAPSLAFQIGHVFERKSLEREVAGVSEREQQRFGQEMHDGLSQQLAGMAMLADGLVTRLKSDKSPHAELASKLLSAAEEAKRQARTLVKNLLPVEVAPDGLMHALRDLASSTTNTFNVKCTFECVKPLPIDNSFAATHLYRIAREAVHNAVKHAQAKHIRIRLVSDGREQLIVSDDGIGLATDRRHDSSGEGLRLMRYRANLIGAIISIEPGAEGGTTVTCTLLTREAAL